MEPTIKYTLLAEVEGMVVYRQESPLIEVIEQSTGHAREAAHNEVDKMLQEEWDHAEPETYFEDMRPSEMGDLIDRAQDIALDKEISDAGH